jgi:hypothetical protein
MLFSYLFIVRYAIEESSIAYFLLFTLVSDSLIVISDIYLVLRQ